jgi:uncharacterized protein YceK
MAMRFAGLLAALVLPILAGCGTVQNARAGDWIFSSGPKEIYGGVKIDADNSVKCCKDCFAGDKPFLENGLPRLAALAGAAYLIVIDLPLSVVGDTLTLPQTIRATMERAKNKPEAAQAEKGTETVVNSDS